MLDAIHEPENLYIIYYNNVVSRINEQLSTVFRYPLVPLLIPTGTRPNKKATSLIPFVYQ